MRQVEALLLEGNVPAAQDLLYRVLAIEPSNARALAWLRHTETDPVHLLGSASVGYTARSGDSWATIARERLKDETLFYALARYNGFPVPVSPVPGQALRLPLRAARPDPGPRVPLSRPVAPAAVAAPVAPEPPTAPAPGRDAYRDRLLAEGRLRRARHDLCGALDRFVQAAALDAGHPQARDEVARTQRLLAQLRQKAGPLDCALVALGGDRTAP